MNSTSESAAPAGQPIIVRPIANLCTSGSCPTIYETGDDSVVVQGFVVSADQAGVALPSGEALVKIPAALLAEALRNLG
ncbi:hypothetical protein [Actinoplanes sp. NPDC051411]|uniref:hypothetical protein n=1 Tax=Actinoplanes sp. NPDC051411 TaxID=3155522 RepID=UPI0034227405